MFIGTKKQAQDPVRDYANECGMPYVNERWLGGMLTNFETIAKRVSKMQEYERMRLSGEFDAMPKKEALLLGRELEKLQKNLGGIRGMGKRPDAVFVLDTKKEHIAVTEANKLKIPVVAVVDTNVDPDVVQYPIPGNDDAIRSNALMSRVIAEAVAEGRYVASRRNQQVATTPRRTAEDEAAFATAQADARRQAAAAQAERDARVAAGATATPGQATAPAAASGAAGEAVGAVATIEAPTTDPAGEAGLAPGSADETAAAPAVEPSTDTAIATDTDTATDSAPTVGADPSALSAETTAAVSAAADSPAADFLASSEAPAAAGGTTPDITTDTNES
jgi:small subunit ribosomal protein S2